MEGYGREMKQKWGWLCNETLWWLSAATTAENVVDLMKRFAESSNTRLSNLATVFLEVRTIASGYCQHEVSRIE